jgi:branched-chain amino acid transport system substrate-binding protein
MRTREENEVLSSRARNPVNFCFSPSILPAHGGNVFASSITLCDSEMATFNRAKKIGFRRYAQLAATDASGQWALQNIKEWQADPANKDVQVVAVEAFGPNDLSVAAQVAKIKAADPDIIYLNAIGTAFGTALRELNNAGLSNVVMVTTPANGSVTQLAAYRAFLPKTLLTVGMPYQGKITNPAMKAAARSISTPFATPG